MRYLSTLRDIGPSGVWNSSYPASRAFVGAYMTRKLAHLLGYDIVDRRNLYPNGGTVPAEPIPGSGPGKEPGEPADMPWDEDAWAERMRAEMEAEAAAGRIPPEDNVQDAWISLAAVRDPAEADLAGLAQGGPLDVMPPDAELAALAARACQPAALAGLSDSQVLGLAAAGRRL